MDLGSQSLVLETVDKNEVAPERMPLLDRNATDCSNSFSHVNAEGSAGANAVLADGIGVRNATADSPAGTGLKGAEPVSSPASTASSPAIETPPTRKGHGLKKWRRIRRDVAKDANACIDSNKILKRVLPAQANPAKSSMSKPSRVSQGDIQDSETSAGSVIGPRFDGVGNGPALHGSAFATSPTFDAGVDSDNSEDRSSKSSTAASAPKFRSELPSKFGYAKEKNRVKNFSGKGLGNFGEHAQQGRGRIESSKKLRGERIKVEQENSQSSVESKLRSSNFVFMYGPFSATSNGNINGTSKDYEGECSGEVQGPQHHFGEETQTAYRKENVEDSEGHSQDTSAANSVSWGVRNEVRENLHSALDHDLLLDSIVSLNSVQELLEKELKEFAEIGREPCSVKGGLPRDGHLDTEHGKQTAVSSLDIQVLTLTGNVEHLEAMLQEARAALQLKESRVSDLEAALNIDTELEGLFRERIEAEIKYLAITITIQSLKIREQQESLNKLSSVQEAKAVNSMKQVEENIDSLTEDIIGVDEVLQFQKRTCKVSCYLFMQLMLLGLVFCLFTLRLSQESAFSIPT